MELTEGLRDFVLCDTNSKCYNSWHKRKGNPITKYFTFSVYTQGGRGHSAVCYTSPQSFIITFSYLLA